MSSPQDDSNILQDLDENGTDSDYSLDYEYIGPRQPNYRDEEDADSDASELSSDATHDGFDMWDEDPYSTNDFSWESNEMKLTKFIKKKKKEIDHINLKAPWKSKSFWRKEKGWPKQLPNSISTTNHDQAANALSLVLSDFGSFEKLHAVYKDRIIECGQLQQQQQQVISNNNISHDNSTTWLDNDTSTNSQPSTSNKFIQTHASISPHYSSIETQPIYNHVHSNKSSSSSSSSSSNFTSKFVPYTKYLKRSQFPIVLPQQAYLSLSFEPMCLAEKYGYMVIGGVEGEFELYCCMNPDNKPSKIWGTKFKGKNNVLLMTNAVQLVRFKRRDTYKHFFIACMNDAGILIYDIPSHQSCHKQQPALQYHIRHFDRVPINDARVSPDGSHLVCVGDGACVFYLSIEFDAHDHIIFSTPKKLKIPPSILSSDSNVLFSSQYVAWSKSSKYFAHTSDSHVSVLIWETQPTLRIVHRIDAGGYTYAIQFHPEFEGVLAFSNRYGYLHTINLDENLGESVRHEITMVSFRGEKDRKLRILTKINGLQWSKDGHHLYVSTKKRVLAYEFLKSSCQVQSLEKMAGTRALSILEKESKKRSRDILQEDEDNYVAQKKRRSRTITEDDWLDQWDKIPLHIRYKLITESHLATHW